MSYRSQHGNFHPRHAAPPAIAINTGYVLIGVLALGCMLSLGSSSSSADDHPPDRSWSAEHLQDRGPLLQRAREHVSRGFSRATAATANTRLLSASPPRVRPPEPKLGTDPIPPLNQTQMDHAAVIVFVGEQMDLPQRALVVAIATALQESNLKNLANPAHPESLELPNDGTGYDHDSVGLFQQRSNSGWGAVPDLMQPEYAAKKFYKALQHVNDWQDLSITAAAQSVQRSAYSNAYAKHESLARDIVAALT